MPPAVSSDLALVAVAAAAPCRDQVQCEQRAVAGPGWFDSSWELRRGLDVREGWSADDRVDGWIESFLVAQRACARTASPSASTAIA